MISWFVCMSIPGYCFAVNKPSICSLHNLKAEVCSVHTETQTENPSASDISITVLTRYLFLKWTWSHSSKGLQGGFWSIVPMLLQYTKASAHFEVFKWSPQSLLVSVSKHDNKSFRVLWPPNRGQNCTVCTRLKSIRKGAAQLWNALSLRPLQKILGEPAARLQIRTYTAGKFFKKSSR